MASSADSEAGSDGNFVSKFLSELLSSPLNLALLGLCGFLLYKIIAGQKKREPDPPREPELPKLKKQDMTLEQLREYGGKGPDGRILFAGNGKIFDVTRGKRFYGPGPCLSTAFSDTLNTDLSEMMENEEVLPHDESEEVWPHDEDKFYSDAKQFWNEMPSTVDGMLGGYEKVSPTDLNGSKAFLRPLLKIGKSRGQTKTEKALDCGAGIGRITKRLLLPIFKSVDMVELEQKFLDEAKTFIGASVGRVGKFICSGLQEFTPEPGCYDLIWCQWVLCHLTEEHLIEFLQRSQKGLAPNGVIVIKENVSITERTEFDTNDSSFLRTRDDYISIINKAGLTIVKQQKQRNWPKGLYAMVMFAVK